MECSMCQIAKPTSFDISRFEVDRAGHDLLTSNVLPFLSRRDISSFLLSHRGVYQEDVEKRHQDQRTILRNSWEGDGGKATINEIRQYRLFNKGKLFDKNYKIFHLDLSRSDITNEELEEILKLCPNVKSLNLYQCNNITNIMIVGRLTQLHTLTLSYTEIVDITPLQNLSELHTLYLARTGIVDIAPLQNLRKLQILVIADTVVVDIAPLKNLRRLHTLYIGKTKVVDITPIQNLPELHTLNLYSSRVINITPLQHLLKLHTLELQHSRVVDITPLQHLPCLNTLNLSSTRVVDITSLQNLSCLHTLNLSYSLVVDTTPLQHLMQRQGFKYFGPPIPKLTLDQKKPIEEAAPSAIPKPPSPVRQTSTVNFGPPIPNLTLNQKKSMKRLLQEPSRCPHSPVRQTSPVKKVGVLTSTESKFFEVVQFVVDLPETKILAVALAAFYGGFFPCIKTAVIVGAYSCLRRWAII